MKKQLITITLSAAIAAVSLGQANLQSNPAYLAIDDAFASQDITAEVNISLPRFLLNDVLSGFDGSENDPLAVFDINPRELLGGIDLVRLMVIDNKKSDPTAVEAGISELQSRLKNGWLPIISVPQDGVGIHAIADESGETMAGFAITVQERDQTVVANVVGNIPLGQIISTANKFIKNEGSFEMLEEAFVDIMEKAEQQK